MYLLSFIHSTGCNIDYILKRQCLLSKWHSHIFDFKTYKPRNLTCLTLTVKKFITEILGSLWNYWKDWKNRLKSPCQEACPEEDCKTNWSERKPLLLLQLPHGWQPAAWHLLLSPRPTAKPPLPPPFAPPSSHHSSCCTASSRNREHFTEFVSFSKKPEVRIQHRQTAWLHRAHGLGP